MEENELDLDMAEAVVKKALARGADEAEVVLSRGASSRTVFRMGKVELLTEAQPYSLGLRVYRKKQGAAVYSSDFTSEALDMLVDTALDMATIADPDEAAGLPDLADLAMNLSEIELGTFDPSIGDIPNEIKIELIKRGEEAAFSADNRVINSQGSNFFTYMAAFGLVNSLGFARSYRSSGCGISISAVVNDAEGKKQNGGWYARSNFFKDLDKPEKIGKLAAEDAVRKIGARKVPTKAVPVVWDQDMAASLVGTMAGMVSGELLERRSTFLIDKIGQQVGSSLFTLIDDPLRVGLPNSRPFDGEGIASRRNVVFQNGVFNQFLFNTYTARKTGQKSTGSAMAGIGSFPGVGITNFYLEPGTATPEEIIAGVDEGLYLTSMMGFGINPVTGDFSRGAEGMWIEKGKITFPVSEINIAGNLSKMLANISQVGNDLDFSRGGVAAPTLRMDNVMVSGL